ncbi:hypothetical protein J2X29_000554 [Shewanella putrefaciens]|nr:hypothetical protein [Shewanella putrefaciens]
MLGTQAEGLNSRFSILAPNAFDFHLALTIISRVLWTSIRLNVQKHFIKTSIQKQMSIDQNKMHFA